eukprot:s2156_g3.t1
MNGSETAEVPHLPPAIRHAGWAAVSLTVFLLALAILQVDDIMSLFWLGSVVNVALSVTKMGLAQATVHHKALMADAVHGLGDTAAEVTALAYAEAARPPDKEHPWGHGKIESMGAVGVTGILLYIAFSMGYDSIVSLAPLLREQAHGRDAKPVAKDATPMEEAPGSDNQSKAGAFGAELVREAMFDFDALEDADPNPGPLGLQWQTRMFANVECRVLEPPGPLNLVLIFFHGSGSPFRVEQDSTFISLSDASSPETVPNDQFRARQERLFTPPRALRLLAAGVAVVLPASPLRDGAVHFWYSTDKDVLVDLLTKAKQQEKAAEEGPPQGGAQLSLKAAPVPFVVGVATLRSAVDQLKDGEPAFLDLSRGTAREVIEAARDFLGLSLASVALAGFSQGRK